jgi:hypothetical protein
MHARIVRIQTSARRGVRTPEAVETTDSRTHRSPGSRALAVIRASNPGAFRDDIDPVVGNC